jgi:hypothetical protein
VAVDLAINRLLSLTSRSSLFNAKSTLPRRAAVRGEKKAHDPSGHSFKQTKKKRDGSTEESEESGASKSKVCSFSYC